MNFTSATILFLSELIVGSLSALVILRRAQIGNGFSRFVAGVATVCATIAITLGLTTGEDASGMIGHEQRVLLVAMCAAVALYLFASVKPSSWFETVALGLALVASTAVL